MPKIYHCILITHSLSLSLWLFMKNNKNIVLNKFTCIFLLTYTLNSPKLMTYIWQELNIKRKIKETIIKSIYTFFFFLMKGSHHLKFTQYLKNLSLNKGGWGIFGKSKGAMALGSPHSAYVHNDYSLSLRAVSFFM